MVSPTDPETKDEPEYGLAAVHRLAGFQQVVYVSKRLQRHVDELDFRLDDVCHALGALQPSDFHRSERYADDPRWHDVYLWPHPTDSDPRQRLYIKFRLTRDCVYIDLCSFHPEGWQ